MPGASPPRVQSVRMKLDDFDKMPNVEKGLGDLVSSEMGRKDPGFGAPGTRASDCRSGFSCVKSAAFLPQNLCKGSLFDPI